MPDWRHLRDDESPFQATGRGPSDGGGEICCPEFDTYAPYIVVWVEDLGRIAKQGKHVLVSYDKVRGEYGCACGLTFSEPQLRGIV